MVSLWIRDGSTSWNCSMRPSVSTSLAPVSVGHGCFAIDPHPHVGSFHLPSSVQPARMAESVQSINFFTSLTNIATNNKRGDAMADTHTQDYFEDKGEGHVDTRERNVDCENKDEHLGCDMGIDVAG